MPYQIDESLNPIVIVHFNAPLTREPDFSFDTLFQNIILYPQFSTRLVVWRNRALPKSGNVESAES
jgi:hypothetical protein